MEDIRYFINWLMTAFLQIWGFVTVQHPAVQAVVFLPLAILIIKLFMTFANIFNGRSI